MSLMHVLKIATMIKVGFRVARIRVPRRKHEKTFVSSLIDWCYCHIIVNMRWPEMRVFGQRFGFHLVSDVF